MRPHLHWWFCQATGGFCNEPHVGRSSVYEYHSITDLCGPEWCPRRMALRLLRSGLVASRSSEEPARLGPSSEVQEPSALASAWTFSSGMALNWPSHW